ncbi:MAG TPA: branched-chain amino acid ABC transporter ATP-binding protein/permease [Burkholderiales bacterium]|nr:branched-chain amino acid ABC transporter ATP-binding protein/permease [Burkholderiales bacterium]
MMRTLGTLFAAGVALACVPLLKLPAFYESFLYLVFFWIVLATSWNILSGYSGYFSFGHGAFFGTGMYATATLTTKAGMPFLWTLPVCAALAALFGVAIGAVVFRAGRLRGELFALLTLAVSYVLATVILNTPIDGGPGVSLAAVAIPQLAPTAPSTFYLLALAAAIVTLAIAYAVQRAALGTGLFAIHDDEDVAEVLGVPTYRYKLAALALSCALAGAAGGIHALFVSYVTVGETFSIVVPLSVVLMSVLGGTRHWLGPAIGAALVTALLYIFTASDYAVAGRAAVGLILIVVILFMPQGVLGRFVRRKPKPASGLEFAHANARIQDLTPSVTPSGETLLSAHGVSKSFAGVQALAGVDLEVRRGEIVGLVGPNGSGKSTLINVVSGHYRADGGRIAFAGHDLTALSAHRIARLGIARTYQIPRPFAHLSVHENVTLAAMFGHAGLPRAAAEREARRWLEYTALAPKAAALPRELNLHQRKFLELARALAARPQLLLLDEVLSGLTPAEIDGAIALVKDIRAQGASIVFVEHVMRAVMQLADRIVVLSYGRVIAEGSPAAVMGRTAVVEAYLGKAHA